jgi:small GTP-binding protein
MDRLGPACSHVAVGAVFDNYSASCWVNGEPIQLSLWDTAGQTEYDPLRPLSYPGTHCFILVCSLDNEASAKAVIDKWLVEIRHHNPDTPFLLVCNKSDLLDPAKTEAAGAKPKPIDARAASRIMDRMQSHSKSEKDCAGFFTCSALTQENLKLVFDTAIRSGLSFQRGEFRSIAPGKKKRLCTIL